MLTIEVARDERTIVAADGHTMAITVERVRGDKRVRLNFDGPKDVFAVLREQHVDAEVLERHPLPRERSSMSARERFEERDEKQIDFERKQEEAERHREPISADDLDKHIESVHRTFSHSRDVSEWDTADWMAFYLSTGNWDDVLRRAGGYLLKTVDESEGRRVSRMLLRVADIMTEDRHAPTKTIEEAARSVS